MKYIVAFVCFLLTISPIDFIPDVIPIVGWLDDIAYGATAIGALRSGPRIGG